MRKNIFLIVCLSLVMMMSGCTTESARLYFVNVSNTLSERTIQYWDSHASERKAGINYFLETDAKIVREFNPCRLYERTITPDHVDYIYYLDECNFSEINQMRYHNNYSVKRIYVKFSETKANLIIRKKINSTFFDLYKIERITADDSVDATIKSMVNELTDARMMVNEIGAEGLALTYIESKFDECNHSESCADLYFEKMETATPRIIQEIKFDNDFLNSCELFLQNAKKETASVGSIKLVTLLKRALTNEFQKAGYDGNPGDYINYNSVCERTRKLYSLIYEGVLDGVSEPTQRFYIATSFYILSRLGEAQESFTSSLNQVIR